MCNATLWTTHSALFSFQTLHCQWKVAQILAFILHVAFLSSPMVLWTQNSCLANSGLSTIIGGSRIFERGVQVQADYGNSMDCFIMAGGYVYAEAVKLEPIRVKRGKFSELWTFEIAFAGFSSPIQRTLVGRSSKLLHLFHRPSGGDSFLLLMACQTYTVTNTNK